MRLSEAHADISVHLMTLNPGPGHGGMSCTSPSKSTFSMAWHHNRNAKNAQSPAERMLWDFRVVCLNSPSIGRNGPVGNITDGIPRPVPWNRLPPQSGCGAVQRL